jgi:hypothetical protein
MFRRRRPALLVAHLAARLQPVHRGTWFRAPLDEMLEGKRAEVIGGGTLVGEDQVIQSCDLEIQVESGASAEQVAVDVMHALALLGAPRGSELEMPDGRRLPFGTWATLDLVTPWGGRQRRDDLQVWHNTQVDEALPRVNEILGARGQVRSWSIFSDGAILHAFGADGDDLIEGFRESVLDGALPDDVWLWGQDNGAGNDQG